MKHILRVISRNFCQNLISYNTCTNLSFLGPYPGQYQATPPFGPPEQQAYGPHNAGQYPPPQAQNQFPNNRQMYPPYGPEGEP